MKLLGIVNVTHDSFSDGGRFLDPAAAIAHAHQLLADGADIIDVGAESTHPASEPVSADEEIAQLRPVVQCLKQEGAVVSVDTRKAAVMRAMLKYNVDFINDVDGFQDPDSVAAVRGSTCKLIVMHRVREEKMHAVTRAHQVLPASIIDHIFQFCVKRRVELSSEGVLQDRLIFDPGMGLFLSPDPAVSLAVLRKLRNLRIRVPSCPLLISTSRKSFIGTMLGPPNHPRPADQRGAGTLATELWAAHSGVEYIRTHDVRALRDAWRLWTSIDCSVGMDTSGSPD